MKTRTLPALTALLAVSLTAAMVAPAAAQNGDLAGLLSGRDYPLTLTVNSLNGDWRHVAIASTHKESAGGGLASLLPLMALGAKGEGGKDSPAAAAMGLSMLGGMFGGMFGGGESGEAVYYTKGQTAVVGGETFLVTYQFKKPELNLGKLAAESSQNGGKEPDFAKLSAESKMTPASTLSLVLLNMRSIGSMKAIRPFNLNREIEEANSAGGLLDLVAASEREKGATKATPPAPARPAPRPAPRTRPTSRPQ